MKAFRKGQARVAFVTLGCPKNEVDSEQMCRRALAAGFAVVEDPEAADIVVVNTCSFIRAATEESLEVIFELADCPSMRSGRRKIVVAGCMPARYGLELEAELVEASTFLPCEREGEIVELLNSLVGENTAGDGSEKSGDGPETKFWTRRRCLENTGGRSAAHGSRPLPERFQCLSPSAYVKLSEGCDRFCSYCTIPFIRGPYRSFPQSEIESEVNRLVSQGVKEIVFIAQDSGRWGQDLPGKPDIADLLARLAAAFPQTWLRLMYLQPEGISEKLLETMAGHPNICRYLDIPLQHADAAVLKSMNRSGSHESYVELLASIREKMPDLALRTTLIAGFPGESEEAFEELCCFLEEAEFDYVGVFAYSQEEGTAAAEMPGQIDEATKLERAQRLRDLADAISIEKISRKTGESFEVLVLGRDEDGQLFGRTQFQAPEVDGIVYITKGQIGDIIRIEIGDTLLYDMEGE
ncbi:MAG: 30S ribosomal protein S12 methylthiotransferase RimO [Eggerthellaceae bacterium]|nr:30S ribosomal protein S12 methylthiotransferase RimO [Eggerthellaceae bacterium]